MSWSKQLPARVYLADVVSAAQPKEMKVLSGCGMGWIYKVLSRSFYGAVKRSMADGFMNPVGLGMGQITYMRGGVRSDECFSPPEIGSDCWHGFFWGFEHGEHIILNKPGIVNSVFTGLG